MQDFSWIRTSAEYGERAERLKKRDFQGLRRSGDVDVEANRVVVGSQAAEHTA